MRIPLSTSGFPPKSLAEEDKTTFIRPGPLSLCPLPTSGQPKALGRLRRVAEPAETLLLETTSPRPRPGSPRLAAGRRSLAVDWAHSTHAIAAYTPATPRVSRTTTTTFTEPALPAEPGGAMAEEPVVGNGRGMSQARLWQNCHVKRQRRHNGSDQKMRCYMRPHGGRYTLYMVMFLRFPRDAHHSPAKNMAL